MDDKKLVEEFDEAMMEIYRRAKSEAGYTASIFHNMLIGRGGLATARQLINDPSPSSGYTALYLKGYLRLTVEAVIHDNAKWHPLFTSEELNICSQRLVDYGYLSR